jgi:hypothetical protein
MQARTRNVWLAGLGVAAAAAAWMLLRPATSGRGRDDDPRFAEQAVGQPRRLVGLALPRPRLRLPRLPRT